MAIRPSVTQELATAIWCTLENCEEAGLTVKVVTFALSSCARKSPFTASKCSLLQRRKLKLKAKLEIGLSYVNFMR